MSDHTRAIGRQFFAEQDRLRGGPVRELCAADYTATIGSNPPMDFAGHEQFSRMFYGAFPDLSHTIEDTVADDDRVAVRFTIRGTQTGPFMGIPATNKSIDVIAIAIMHIEGGQVARLHAVFDQAKMLQQLGVMPG